MVHETINNRKILVTGSSGTVGTAVCEKLIESGYDLFCTDRTKNNHNQSINQITILTDLTDKNEIFEKFPTDINCIIHLAAHARVPSSIENPSLAKDNFQMTFNILEFARLNGIKKGKGA